MDSPASTASGRRTPTPIQSLTELLRARRGMLAFIVGLSLIGAVSSLAQPLMISLLIEEIGLGNSIQWLVLGISVLLVTAALAGGFQQFLLERTSESIVLDVRLKLAEHMAALRVQEYDKRPTGDLVARVTSDTTLLRGALTGGLVDAISSGVVFIGSLVAMCVIDPTLFGITFAVVVVSTLGVLAASSHVQRITHEAQGAVGTLAASLDRSLTGIRTIRAFGATGRELTRVGLEARRAFSLGVDLARIRSLLEPVTGLAFQCSFLIILGVGGSRVSDGSMTIANLIAFLLFLFMMIIPLGQILGAITAVRSVLGALARVNEILDLPTEEESTPSGNLPVSATPRDPILEFRDVHFAYDSRDTLVGLDLIVTQGTTAIVGPSGAGKSTVLALVERFYEPDRGTILFSGTDIRDLSRSDLRGHIAYVEQSAPAFAGTIRENLTLGEPTANDESCRRALQQVGLLDRVDAHPLGLEAPLGDEGAGFSGGERQRLAIARALLANCWLLMLDEPTASLDANTEQALHRALSTQSGRHALLIVAHRLSTVMNADQIVVMDQGRVIAVGRHSELVKTCPLYEELARRQLLS